jgi:ABC-2 type transport system permease protein
MLTLLFVELRKLKGSLVLLLCLVAPLIVSLFLLAMATRQPVMPWADAVANGTGLWSFFMLPMTIIALSILLAGVEHGPRAWDHILALPTPRWRIFAAKAAVMMLLVAIMSAMLLVEIRLVGMLLPKLAPAKAFTGAFPWRVGIVLVSAMTAASLFMGMIQLWTAIRFRTFVAPMGLGLAGTFIAVAAAGAKESIFLPWSMPVAILANQGARSELAFQIGVIGGLVTLGLMLVDLSRREA